MPVQVRWYDEAQTIVLYEIQGNWTWDELYPEYTRAIQMEKSVPHRVDVLIDMRRSGRLPLNVLTHMKRFSDHQPYNIGLSIVITESQFVRALYQAGCKFYSGIGRYFAVAPSPEEALAMIAAARSEPVKT
jgi:hypothetical protein